MKIWRCPRCDTGRRAPSRMNHLDVRRWCLDCSAETGKLVEMVCPALERKRAQVKDRQLEKQRKQRAREREAFLLEDGTDMRKIIRKARGLKTWEKEGGARYVRRVKVDLQIGEPSGAHGRANVHRAHIHLRKETDPFFATLLVIHEFTHVLMHGTGLSRPSGSSRHSWHGVNFHSILKAAALEWWPELEDELELIKEVYRERGGKDRAYSMDRALEVALAKAHPEILERQEMRAASRAAEYQEKIAGGSDT